MLWWLIKMQGFCGWVVLVGGTTLLILALADALGPDPRGLADPQFTVALLLLIVGLVLGMDAQLAEDRIDG